MPKRKFEDATDSDTVDAPARRKVPRQGGLDGILDNGKKTLFRAFKVSRGFERQKLGRRQKTAKEQNAPAETARLAQEVIALKVGASTIVAVEVLKAILTDIRFPRCIGVASMEITAQVEAHLHLFCVSSIHCGEGFAVFRAPEHGDGECYGSIV